MRAFAAELLPVGVPWLQVIPARYAPAVRATGAESPGEMC
jgi:hypothetical protein